LKQESLGAIKNYLSTLYQVYQGTADLYAYFIEKGISLLRDGGFFSYIVANKWMRANYGTPLRRWLKGQNIERIIDFGDLPVFQEATTYPCIILISKRPPASSFNATQVKTLEFTNLTKYVNENSYTVDQTKLNNEGWSLADTHAQDLQDKLRNQGIPLGEYVDGKIYRGILTGLNEAFVIDVETRNKLITEDPKSSEVIKPFLAGRDIKRYQSPESKKYLIFTRRGINIDNYPAIKQHLLQFKDQLMPKPEGWTGPGKWKGRKPGKYQWYEVQDTIGYYTEFEKKKILWPGISAEVSAFAFDVAGYYGNDNNQLIISDDLYLLGILNSHLMCFALKNICDKVQGGFYRLKIIYIEQVPIPVINASDPQDRAHHDHMVSLVEQMLDLYKQKQSEIQGFLKWLEGEIGTKIMDLTGASKLYEYYNLDISEFHALLAKNKGKLKEGYNPRVREHKELLEKEFNNSADKIKTLTASVEETDRQIDDLVYKLYNLTEEEIELIERA
jgi:hypothetical protein